MAKRIYTKYDILEGLDEFEMTQDVLLHDAVFEGLDEFEMTQDVLLHDALFGADDDTPPYGIPRPTELPDED